MTRARDTADLLVSAPTAQALESKTTVPLFMNGAMMVHQKQRSYTGITGTGWWGPDRYKIGMSNIGTWSISQDTDVPSGQGFKKSIKLDCTTADGSLAAGDIMYVAQFFEGQQLQCLKKGTSDAEKVTVAFWVKSGKTGTHIFNVVDNDNTRSISKAYTISSANTWEKKVIVIDADTTGALGNDNGSSWQMFWWMGGGSDWSGGTLQTTWGSKVEANRAVGQVNLADSTDNNFLLTGIQMEIGEYDSTSLPTFRHMSHSDELLRCQRYFFAFADGADQQYALLGQGSAASGNTLDVFVHTPVEMRAVPTLDLNNASNYYQVRDEDGSSNFSGMTGIHSYCTTKKYAMYVSYPGGITQGIGAIAATNNTAAYTWFRAEL